MVFLFSLLVVIDIPDLFSECSHIQAHFLLFNSEWHVVRSIELQTKWSVLPWPGHMGVAWNVSSVLYFYLRESQCRIFFHWYIPTLCVLSSCVFPALWPSHPCGRSVPQQGPVGRSWHSFTPVSPDHIFLFGGFTTERETLSTLDILFCLSKIF